MKKTVSIVWWGIWWLASAILLAKDGYDVSVYEKNECLWWRASIFQEQWYTFDMWPSRYLMPDLFEEFFQSIWEDINQYLDLKKLSPSYKVFYPDSGDFKSMDVYADIDRMAREFEKIEEWSGEKFKTFLKKSWIQYKIWMDFAKRNYDSVLDFFRWDIAWKGLKLNIFTTIDKYVARFFKTRIIQKIMQYTTVFLWTAPNQTPALYNIMSHVDFAMGVWYPSGWLHMIAKALEKIWLKYGVKYYLNSELKSVNINWNKISSIVFVDGKYCC